MVCVFLLSILCLLFCLEHIKGVSGINKGIINNCEIMYVHILQY